MGCYVDVAQPDTKENWLHENGEVVPEPTWENTPEGELPVCLVDNGPFKAAGVAYSEEEFNCFISEGDPRPKTWFMVNTDKLMEVSPLDQYLPEGRVANRLMDE